MCYNAYTNSPNGKEHKMYHRQTTTAAELSAARRRASLSRKNRRGGRPKGFCKVAARPPSTIGIDPLDAAVLRNYASMRGFTLRQTLHLFAGLLVLGTENPIPARANLAPEGWEFKGV